jgi:hypothetical protein
MQQTYIYIYIYIYIRGSDSENFGARIIEFGVLDGKMWLTEFLGANLSFWKALEAYLYVYMGSSELENSFVENRGVKVEILMARDLSRIILQILGLKWNLWKREGLI